VTVVVLMGVSGCGKTTVGRDLAARLGWQFQEGDALHPRENVAKMAGGTPLVDEDRWPWLAKIAEVIDGWRADGVSGVVTCSALKRRYRDILIGDRPDVRLVHLFGPQSIVAARLAARRGHFMPSALLASQFATLEQPGKDENPVIVAIAQSPEGAVDQIIAAIS